MSTPAPDLLPMITDHADEYFRTRLDLSRFDGALDARGRNGYFTPTRATITVSPEGRTVLDLSSRFPNKVPPLIISGPFPEVRDLVASLLAALDAIADPQEP